jgi:predicted acyltransferase
MIVVNMSISPTLSYAQLLHASWDGFTLTDAVFPTFLFVVGAAIGLNLERHASLSNQAAIRQILTRVGWLFFWGLVVSNAPFFIENPDHSFQWLGFDQIRVFGVLQRIALTYGVTATLARFTTNRQITLISILSLVVYAVLCISGGRGTLSDNLPLKVDLALLGGSHLYHGEGVPFDPEGLLSTLPAIVNVCAGFLCIRFIRSPISRNNQFPLLIAYGVTFGLIGLVLSTWIPINKKLWSVSYVLWMIGLDVLVLTIIMKAMHRPWFVNSIATFAKPFGYNTLFIYVLAECLMSILGTLRWGASDGFTTLYTQFFQSWAADKPGSLLYALTFMGLCWILAFILMKNKIYLRA